MPSLKVAFLDVGHGDFVYISTPLGESIVVDIGSGDVIPSIFLNQLSLIHELQITHPHTDHFDDIINFSKMNIKSFVCPPLDNFSDQAIGWKKSDKTKITMLRTMTKNIAMDGNAITQGNGFYRNIWISGDIDYNDPNTTSLVTTLTYMGKTILLGGDLPASGWNSLLRNSSFCNDISNTLAVKVPHHGRKEGCSEELFERISPLLCIVSDKALVKDNKNTIATEWYIRHSRGCHVNGCNENRKVLSTRCDNSIFLKIDSDGRMWVYSNMRWING